MTARVVRPVQLGAAALLAAVVVVSCASQEETRSSGAVVSSTSGGKFVVVELDEGERVLRADGVEFPLAEDDVVDLEPGRSDAEVVLGGDGLVEVWELNGVTDLIGRAEQYGEVTATFRTQPGAVTEDEGVARIGSEGASVQFGSFLVDNRDGSRVRTRVAVVLLEDGRLVRVVGGAEASSDGDAAVARFFESVRTG